MITGMVIKKQIDRAGQAVKLQGQAIETIVDSYPLPSII